MSLSSQQASSSVGSFLWLLSGDASTSGPTGPTGSSPTGPQGPAGSPTGEVGPTGNNGTQGVQGAQGSPGLSVTGPTGTAGATGPVGSPAPTGPAGATGATGLGFTLVETISNVTLANGAVFNQSTLFENNRTLKSGIYALSIDCSASPIRNVYQEYFWLQQYNAVNDRFIAFISFVQGNNIGKNDNLQTSLNYINNTNIVKLEVANEFRNLIQLTNTTSNASDNYTLRTYLITNT